MKFISLICLTFLFSACSAKNGNKQTITFKAEDGLIVTANLYPNVNKKATVMVLCHQAGWNKSEYAPIAPRLVKMGYTCIAVDQRSGGTVNKTYNSTHISALTTDKIINYYTSALDIKAAVKYAQKNYPDSKIILWGSSYSASLALIIGCEDSAVSAIISFSPGEYFDGKPHYVANHIKGCTKPVFFSSKKSEAPQVKVFYNLFKSKLKQQFIPKKEGFHGSRALWKDNAGSEAIWKALSGFLKKMGD